MVCHAQVTIPLEKAIVLREYRNGTYSLISYWMGRLTMSILSVLLINLLTVCHALDHAMH